MNFIVTGNIVDIFSKNIFPGEVIVENGKIKSVNRIG